MPAILMRFKRIRLKAAHEMDKLSLAEPTDAAGDVAQLHISPLVLDLHSGMHTYQARFGDEINLGVDAAIAAISSDSNVLQSDVD